MVDHLKRSKKSAPGPMDEENFPDNPTRRAADREMDEPTNVPSSADPLPHKPARVREEEDEE